MGWGVRGGVAALHHIFYVELRPRTRNLVVRLPHHLSAEKEDSFFKFIRQMPDG